MSPESTPSPVTRDIVANRILAAAQEDPRIVGLADYGSSNRGQADELSDLDLAIFVRDADMDAFEAGWKAWAGQFGPLLLAYISGVGHPWVVYDATPVPLRVDLAFRRESDVEEVLDWTTTPGSVEAMVWHDDTGGVLARTVEQIVGQPLAPADLRATFEQVCGDLWYYLLRTTARVQRREIWAARHDYNSVITGNLLALLRLEARALERWRGTSAASGIESVLTDERLAQLEETVPDRGEAELCRAMVEAARLGYEVSAQVALHHGWAWPEHLARQIIALLEKDREQQPKTRRNCMGSDARVRELLLQLLSGSNAHLTFEMAVKDFPLDQINARPPGVPYSLWHLLEHIRIAQWDILEFSRDPDHVSPDWPAGYWPAEDAEADAMAWQATLAAIRRDLRALEEMVRDADVDLYADLPHAAGFTVLREIMLVADHNAYHIGEFAILRQVMGTWSS